jgi:hypothetical protein
VNVTIPIVTSVVTFIVYALLGNTITPAVAFTVVSLFQIIRNPFGQVPQTLTMYDRAPSVEIIQGCVLVAFSARSSSRMLTKTRRRYTQVSTALTRLGELFELPTAAYMHYFAHSLSGIVWRVFTPKLAAFSAVVFAEDLM